MPTDADRAINRRIDRVDTALAKAMTDLKAVARRIGRLQARRNRLVAALAAGSDARRTRAQKALETRRAVPAHRQRGIRVTEAEEYPEMGRAAPPDGRHR